MDVNMHIYNKLSLSPLSECYRQLYNQIDHFVKLRYIECYIYFRKEIQKKSVKSNIYSESAFLNCVIKFWKKVFSQGFIQLKPSRLITSRQHIDATVELFTDFYPSNFKDFILKVFSIIF